MPFFRSCDCLLCGSPFVPDIGWNTFFLGEAKEEVCRECRKKLVKPEGPLCPLCSRPLNKAGEKYRRGNRCRDCHFWEKSAKFRGVLEKNISLYEYNGFLREVLYRFKYRGDYKIARAFSRDLKNAVKRLPFDAAVPIPLSEERLYERGFNQAEALIAEAGLEPLHALTRVHSEKQAKKSKTDRILLAGVFQLHPASGDVKGKTFLLVDDVYTTGSTVRHAARVLKEAGAQKILSLTVARS
ncbi:MAG: amidophosphoribosyltransferase [Caldibacillus debilis]|uniref:Amidophosphoribosyltransferase n=1 Tax=Caldibacillus debilis TaxID=301148 RepID=A0A3E0K317_9BACI|nr:ComF family protein [Caldibacillus debilis]REJ27574.1 MAG: amidophosphoribosyltransferase [Caldibacillus debilis]REJ29685.1 MAG: amidophosphoribosyltransferase [Caldibacillus debilis]